MASPQDYVFRVIDVLTKNSPNYYDGYIDSISLADTTPTFNITYQSGVSGADQTTIAAIIAAIDWGTTPFDAWIADYNSRITYVLDRRFTAKRSVVVGYHSDNGVAGEGTVVVGSPAPGGSSGNSGSFAVIIGYDAVGSADCSVVIGSGSSDGLTKSIAIGYQVGFGGSLPADGSIAIYTLGYPTTSVQLSQPTHTSAPSGLVIKGTSGSGTNIAGQTFTIRAGQSTGNANGGSITFEVGDPGGSSGTTANSYAEVLRLTNANQSVLVTGNSVSIPALAVKPKASSTVDTAQVQNSSGTKKVWVDKNGVLGGQGGNLYNVVAKTAVFGRLTTEAGVAKSTSDRTSQGTLYWTACNNSNAVALYDGSDWVPRTLGGDVGLSLSLTSGKNYDVYLFTTSAVPSSTNTTTDVLTFASATGWATGSLVTVDATGGGLTAGTTYWYNAASSTTGSLHTSLANALAGTSKVDLTASITATLTGVSMELSAAWTNDTTRADAQTTQDAVVVKSGDATRRNVGVIRASGTNVTEDSLTKRFVWNRYNQVRRRLLRQESTDNWAYNSATFRQVNGSGSNQVEVVVGDAALSEVSLFATLLCGSAAVNGNTGIGVDSTSSNSAETMAWGVTGQFDTARASLNHEPTLGYHYYAWLEACDSAVSKTFYGDNGSPTKYQSGLSGYCLA